MSPGNRVRQVNSSAHLFAACCEVRPFGKGRRICRILNRSSNLKADGLVGDRTNIRRCRSYRGCSRIGRRRRRHRSSCHASGFRPEAIGGYMSHPFPHVSYSIFFLCGGIEKDSWISMFSILPILGIHSSIDYMFLFCLSLIMCFTCHQTRSHPENKIVIHRQ